MYLNIDLFTALVLLIIKQANSSQSLRINFKKAFKKLGQKKLETLTGIDGEKSKCVNIEEYLDYGRQTNILNH